MCRLAQTTPGQWTSHDIIMGFQKPYQVAAGLPQVAAGLKLPEVARG